MKQEITVKPISGYLMVIFELLLLGGLGVAFANEIIWFGVLLLVLFCFLAIGFTVVNPTDRV